MLLGSHCVTCCVVFPYKGRILAAWDRCLPDAVSVCGGYMLVCA